jgi:hypothetical protein
MTDFAVFLGEKLKRYIELRRALGYAFNKQAGTLRAFVRHIERAELDAPATRTMALDFVLSFVSLRQRPPGIAPDIGRLLPQEWHDDRVRYLMMDTIANVGWQ